MRRGRAGWIAGALAAAAVACGTPDRGEERAGAPRGGPDRYAGPPSTWVAEWTLLVYAANDVRDPALAAAFDQDAAEWQRGLGGSALFRVLVERDYPPPRGGDPGAPALPSERYGIYRERCFDPSAPPPEDGEGGTCAAMRLGETDSSDPATLEAFLVDGIRRFPARHYWVVITGHGDGWNGLAFDETTGPGRRMTIAGLGRALRAGSEVIEREIRPRPGLGGPGTSGRIDVVQFDVCRLGAIEVAASLGDAASAMVASQEEVPDAGHPYSALRFIAQDNPGVAPRALVRAVVTDYVRSYVTGVSTQARDYVGTSVTSVGLDLGRLRPLVGALGRLREAVRRERPKGFDCAEVRAIGARAMARAGIAADRDGRGPAAGVRGGGRSTAASRAAVDLVALLEELADPARIGAGAALHPRVTVGVSVAARDALGIIDRPRLWTPAEAAGAPLLYGGQYRELVPKRLDSPVLVEAQRVDPAAATRTRGLSVFWGNPLDLLAGDDFAAPMDLYRELPYEAMTGWTGMLEACLDQARACVRGAPDPALRGRTHAPSPCAGLGER
ncbi:MAG: hypothetical protein IT372_20010 [Polyangiaceae bacterium]|nr:hypothetical protein [Polyangiaceae bacterium]